MLLAQELGPDVARGGAESNAPAAPCSALGNSPPYDSPMAFAPEPALPRWRAARPVAQNAPSFKRAGSWVVLSRQKAPQKRWGGERGGGEGEGSRLLRCKL